MDIALREKEAPALKQVQRHPVLMQVQRHQHHPVLEREVPRVVSVQRQSDEKLLMKTC